MTSEITYQGIVSIKIQNKPTVNRKNNGTKHLFASLCNLLGKNVVDSVKLIPSKIAVIHDNNKNGETSITSETIDKDPDYNKYKQYSVLINELSIVKSTIDSTNSSITFNANLSYSEILSNIESSSGFILLINSENQILAYTTTDYNAISNIKEQEDINSQATISWQMSFANSQSTEVTA